MDYKEWALVDTAEVILKKSKEPINIYDLFDIVAGEKGLSAEEKDVYLTHFYSDITISGRFVYTGDNTWDLKAKQKIELWEKDGSFYNEYTDVEDLQPEVEEPKVKEEVVEVVQPKVEKEPVEVKTDEEVIIKDNETLNQDAENIFDDFEEEDDFDEEEYNKYMDTYEEKYDE
ncbi:MAG: DNA-directed RNA polymerase subunit delta [Candidatus Izemoplasmataceae bacterium]